MDPDNFSTNIKPVKNYDRSSDILAVTFIAFLSLIMWWFVTKYLDLKIALKGFTPIEWIYRSIDPSLFANDFPNGVNNFDKSAFMQIYKLAYQYLGITPETLMPIIIGLEILGVAFAVYYFSKALFPDYPVIASLILVILVIGSFARNMNFARFFQPFFIGQFYNVVDILRILAIAFFIKERATLSFLMAALSFVVHPTLGLIGLIFICSMLAAKPADVLRPRSIYGLCVFFIIAAGWLLLTMQNAELSAGSIPSQVWFTLTKLGSVHWYPVDYGLFDLMHEERFIPFLSFIMLFIFYFGRLSPRRDIDNRLAVAIGVLLIMTFAGIIISVIRPSPALIKLSLHRANDLVIFIGLAYIVRGLFGELTSNDRLRQVLAFMIIASPFVFSPGFPLLFTILLTYPAWMRVRTGDSQTTDKAIAALVITNVVFLSFYAITGSVSDWFSEAYIGTTSSILFASATGMFLILLWVFKGSQRKLEIALLIILATLSISWASKPEMGQKMVSIAQDYKKAQLWARQNTEKSALFMVDPTIYYGWRDFSHRSSFGNLREWIHTSWLYDSKAEVYREGIKRFNEYSIDLNKYLTIKPPKKAFKKLSDKAQKKYYTFGDGWRKRMAKKYGIDYFVMRKDLMKNSSKMKVAYENKNFVVLQP